MKKEFNIVIEQDEDGYYIASVPELPGCHTQAKSLDELNKRVIEAIELYLEVDKEQRYWKTIINLFLILISTLLPHLTLMIIWKYFLFQIHFQRTILPLIN